MTWCPAVQRDINHICFCGFTPLSTKCFVYFHAFSTNANTFVASTYFCSWKTKEKKEKFSCKTKPIFLNCWQMLSREWNITNFFSSASIQEWDSCVMYIFLTVTVHYYPSFGLRAQHSFDMQNIKNFRHRQKSAIGVQLLSYATYLLNRQPKRNNWMWSPSSGENGHKICVILKIWNVMCRSYRTLVRFTLLSAKGSARADLISVFLFLLFESES